MKPEIVTYHRNRITHGIYTHLLKPAFFRNDPELVHNRMIRVGERLGRHSFGRKLTRGMFDYDNPILEQEIFGLHFRNPIGLSAGFDKNAELTDILPSVGFGFVEVGSITGSPCAGNPKPRLWRLPKSRGLVVHYGLNNDGCDIIADRLRRKKFAIPVGVNIAMTNCKDNLDIKRAVEDYARAFRVMEPIGSYITVNISCPNAAGGQPFVVPHSLDCLLDILDMIPTEKPVFIKLSPDVSRSGMDDMLDVIRSHRVHGIICANLTKRRVGSKIIDDHIPEVGGMSGKVVQDLADEMLAYIYKREGKRLVIIGSGGVFAAEDAYKKIRLGASLVQIMTGMIFEGPQVISEINQGLAKLLKRDGFTNISQAIGVDTC